MSCGLQFLLLQTISNERISKYTWYLRARYEPCQLQSPGNLTFSKKELHDRTRLPTAATHCSVLLSVFTSHWRTYGSKKAVMLNVTSPLFRDWWVDLVKACATHWGTKASYIPNSVLVRRYRAKMSCIGTSGVGPFIEDSNRRFWEFCRSVIRCGIVTSTTRDTRSSFLFKQTWVESDCQTWSHHVTPVMVRGTSCLEA